MFEIFIRFSPFISRCVPELIADSPYAAARRYLGSRLLPATGVMLTPRAA
jgi:hypothetical protein